MKKLIDAIKKALGMDKKSSDSSSSGFTLIELLVVIAVIGVLAAAVLIAIDPIDRLNAAKDSRTQQDIASLAKGVEQYAVQNNGTYPATLDDLRTGGQMKSIPTPPNGGNYAYNGASPAVITGPLFSKKYVNATPTTQNFWKYEGSSGKSCPVNATTSSCP
jgi:prepilin-type N-terminal cleavage/methylation domain-containing protein